MSLTAAGVAAAAEATATPATGVAGDKGTSGYALIDKNDTNKKAYEAALITLTIAGKTVDAYCIDLHTNLAHAEYQETAWKASTVRHLEKVQWILTHSVPSVSATDVLNAAGKNKPAGMSDDKLWKLVYAATQGAIWHNSDDLEVAVPGGADYELLKAVYDYLVAGADQAQGVKEPAPTLSITPPGASGEVGSKLGPYTVNFNSSEKATLTVNGGKIVDANGAPVTAVPAGGKFWLTSDKAGTVAVDAAATAKVPTGRVFTLKGKPDDAQKVILAGEAKAPLVAHATGTFTPKAAPTLPVTGASAVGAAVGGGVLLGGGGLLVAMLRRRRVKFTA